MTKLTEPWMPKEEDYNNGIDHWQDCEDPLNCNCADLVTCPTCDGYGFVIVDYSGDKDSCPNPHCEEGLIHKDYLR